MTITKRARVCFFGGMANNCYLIACRMHELGMDVVYIRDRLDNYAISQPVWEDRRLSLTYEELTGTAAWSPERWDDMATQCDWVAPEWVVDPLSCGAEDEPNRGLLVGNEGLRNYLPAPADHYKKIIAIMRDCDLVFASNVHAVILAYLSGKPFIICPTGGEFLVAAGLIDANGDQNVANSLAVQKEIMKRAFRRAQAVMTYTRFFQHAGLAGGYWQLIRHHYRTRFERVSLPYLTKPRMTSAQRREKLNLLLVEFNLAPVVTKYSIFVPSRIDYQWKGQNRLLEALDQIECRDEFTVICAGWGADFEDFRARVGTSNRFRILDRAMSKPILNNFYASVDLVVDQFVLGHIGSAAREAAAVGAPVLASIQSGWSARLDGNDFPALNATSAEDIGRVLTEIARGDVDLCAAGLRHQAWVERYAAPSIMHNAIMRHVR